MVSNCRYINIVHRKYPSSLEGTLQARGFKWIYIFLFVVFVMLRVSYTYYNIFHFCDIFNYKVLL